MYFNSVRMGFIPGIDKADGPIVDLLEDALDAICVFDLVNHEANIRPSIYTRPLESLLAMITRIDSGRKCR